VKAERTVIYFIIFTFLLGIIFSILFVPIGEYWEWCYRTNKKYYSQITWEKVWKK